MDREFTTFLGNLTKGDPQAWYQFKYRYEKVFFGLARQHQNIDGEDLFQEVSARLVANNYALLKAFNRGGETGFYIWLVEIARRVTHEMLRENQKQRKLFNLLLDSFCSVTGRSFDPVGIFNDRLVYQKFLCAWHELPHIRQQVVLLVMDGFRHREIALKLGISLNTSLSHYNRAIRYLRQCLGYELDVVL